MIPDLLWKEVSSQEGGLSSQKVRKACFFTAMDPMNAPMLTPRFIENEPRLIPHRMKWKTVRNTIHWFYLTKVWVLLAIKEQCNAVVQYNASRKFGEKVVNIKKDQVHEEVRHVRWKERPYAAQQAVGDNKRLDRPILKMTPRIDQIIHGVPKMSG